MALEVVFHYFWRDTALQRLRVYPVTTNLDPPFFVPPGPYISKYLDPPALIFQKYMDPS